jgi:hypothetical protein
MQVGDWVVPKNKKVITQIEEIEHHDSVILVYTSDRSAYSKSDLMTIREAYELETNKL